MPLHPIHVPRHSYRGRQPKRIEKRRRFNEVATQLERYINDTVARSSEDTLLFSYAELADQLGMDVNVVREVLFGVDGGHNGIRVTKAMDTA